MGPRIVVAKQGEYGAALFTEDGFFALPGYPLEEVLDPTGAGDSFAGGFLGYLDAHGEEQTDQQLLRRAMTYGSVMASFNVEQFGTERVRGLTLDEINERFAEFKRDDALRGGAGRGKSSAVAFQLLAIDPAGRSLEERWRPSRRH